MIKQFILYGIFIALGYYAIGVYNDNKAQKNDDTAMGELMQSAAKHPDVTETGAQQEYDTVMGELMQSAAKHPDVTETEAISIEARKMADKQFSGDKDDKVKAAAMFYGFRYRHVVGYAKYCSQYNLTVDNYISAFNDYYRDENVAINEILASDARKKLDTMLDADVMRMIKIEFRDSTSQHKVTEEQICSGMNMSSQAKLMIKEADYKKRLPQAHALIF